MNEVVASGRTVEDAKMEALKELGVDSENQVEIEVIDEGSKGVFGWGTKFARVKVRLKEGFVKADKGDEKPGKAATKQAFKEEEDIPPSSGRRGYDFLSPRGAPALPAADNEYKDYREHKKASEPREQREYRQPSREQREYRQPNREQREYRQPREQRDYREPREQRDYREPREQREYREPREQREYREPREQSEYREPREQREYREPREPRESRERRDRKPHERRETPDQAEYREKREREPVEFRETYEPLPMDDEDSPNSPSKVILSVMKKMNLQARVEKARVNGNEVYSIFGDDLGILIGKHGQTLEALQFIINLILLRKTGAKKKITLDVEGYRSRREKSLRELARRLADKVKREKRKVVLEPMLPSERRIIHLTLQKNPHIYTYSQGEEPMRKVIISLKKPGGRQ